MKHHEYQLYYGGFKKKLKNSKYCATCGIITKIPTFIWPPPQHKINVRSHKKQTVLPRYKLKYKSWKPLVLSKKN